MAYPLGFETLPADESLRVRGALAMLAWAYLAALARSDWNKASQLLSVFQQTFLQYKDTMLASYPEDARAGVRDLLQDLRVTMQYDTATHRAIVVALRQGWATNAAQATAVFGLPDAAGAAARYFPGSMAFLAPAGHPIWAIDSSVRAMPAPDVTQTIAGEVSAYILGLEQPTHAPALPSPSSAVANATGDPAQATTGPEGTAPSPSTTGASTFTLPTARITPIREGMPVWGIFAIGAGVLVAGGILWWGMKR